MMLANGGPGWRTSRNKIPPSQAAWSYIRRTRYVPVFAVLGGGFLLWMIFGGSGEALQNSYCWGPAKAPIDMSPNEQARWHAHLQTPVIFNKHDPVEVDHSTIKNVNLNPIKSTPRAAAMNERILILTPLKDTVYYLDRYFELLTELTYPHHLIDLAFLVGDSQDDTKAVLASELNRIQNTNRIAFRSAMIVEKDFGTELLMDVESRHALAAQASRRKLLGKVRNYLLYSALKPDHSWVYWRDADLQDCPKTVIEDFVRHDRDVLVPNIWFHRYEKQKGGRLKHINGGFDYNSWVESEEGLKLAASLEKDTVLAEGYKEYPTNRTYLVKMGSLDEDPHEEVELDGIGGVNIIVKADVHRSGVNFPGYAFENQAETEGFAKMAKRAGYGVYGLPNYIVWHIDTQEKPGNAG